MFISLSAAALDKYEWYTFEGKRAVSFKNHHKSHELILMPKDRFGVRTYANKIRVVDITDPSSVFILSDKEVNRIIGRSKGFSGRVKGVKLKAGQGGLDVPIKKVAPPKIKVPTKVKENTAGPRKTRVHKPDGEFVDYDSKYFPYIAMPPNKAEILRLYHYFNKLHFKRELPDKLVIQLSGSHKLAGEALARHAAGKVAYKMRIGKRALTDIPRICSIIIHEMIHILHFKRLFEDVNEEYRHASHGPLFLEEMHRLNKFGYSINIIEDKAQEAKLAKPEYVLLVEANRKDYVVMHSSKPFKDKIPILLDQMRARTAKSITMTKYIYGTTSSSYVFQGSRLTSSQQIPKSPRMSLFSGRSDEIKGILSDVKVLDETTIERSLVGVRRIVEAAVDQCISVIQIRLGAYYVTVMTSAGLIKRNWVPGNDWQGAAKAFFSLEERNFIEDTWKGAEDRHFAGGNIFAQFKKDLLKLRLDGQEAAEYLARRYEEIYYKHDDRMDSTRFIGICVEALGDIITIPDDEFIPMLREELHNGK